jgi:arylsulfatase A-like enzyme
MKTLCLKRWLLVLTALSLFKFTARADDAATNSLASIFANVHAQVAIPRRPSIIFIQFHGLGFGDLSCYGQTNFQTPNLDKLAAESIRFNNYLPGDTNAVAVQSALMTGKNSSADGVTVAQVLKNAGYFTGLFGEWNLVAQPWTQGFDDFAGTLNDETARNYYPDQLWRRLLHSVPNPTNGTSSDYLGQEMLYDNTGGKKGKYLPDYLLTTVMPNFIRINQPDKFNRFRPFFLLMNISAPRTAALGADDFPVPSDAPYSDEAWPQAAKNRAALITRLDGDIGRLFETLAKYKLTNNVVIFVSSSAPPEKFADPRLNFFRTPVDFQSSTNGNWNAPMIAWWPGHIAAGQVSDFKWSPVDFLPTAAQIGYITPPEKFDGKSILPVLLGQKNADQP